MGMVVETSEFTSSDESSDDEDQVKPGDVRVAWYPAGNEEVLPEKKLHLADRSVCYKTRVSASGFRYENRNISESPLIIENFRKNDSDNF